MATIQGFTADGLFIGQSSEFFRVINELAEEADKAGQHSDFSDELATEPEGSRREPLSTPRRPRLFADRAAA